MSDVAGYRCPCCGRWSDGYPSCWKIPLPDTVASIPEAERAGRVEHLVEGELIAQDGQHFFIHANLDLPVVGGGDALRFTCWLSLSERNAMRQLDHWLTEGRERALEPMVGYLCNEIAAFPGSALLVGRIHTQPVGVRPVIELQPTDHPLAAAQRDGVSPNLVFRIAHDNGCGCDPGPG